MVFYGVLLEPDGEGKPRGPRATTTASYSIASRSVRIAGRLGVQRGNGIALMHRSINGRRMLRVYSRALMSSGTIFEKVAYYTVVGAIEYRRLGSLLIATMTFELRMPARC